MTKRRARDLAALQDPALAPLQAALTADGAPEELTGEAAALSAYSAESWSGRRSWHGPAVLATKVGAITAACLVALSGVATAAYTGSLPDTLQNVAHKAIKAPKAHPPTQAVGPDASGDAAYGLCQAFAKDKADKENKAASKGQAKAEEVKGAEHGTSEGKGKAVGKPDAGADRGQSKERSVAYRNLVRAAGGEDKVEAYCASVPKPTGSPDPAGTGKPTAKPTQAATGKPTPKPTQAPAVKPSELPTPAQTHPTGSPSPLPTGSPEEVPAG